MKQLFWNWIGYVTSLKDIELKGSKKPQEGSNQITLIETHWKEIQVFVKRGEKAV